MRNILFYFILLALCVDSSAQIIGVKYEILDVKKGARSKLATAQNSLPIKISFPEIHCSSSLYIFSSYSIYNIDSAKLEEDCNSSFQSYVTDMKVIKNYNQKKIFVLQETMQADKIGVTLFPDGWQIDRTKVKYILGLKCFYAAREEDNAEVWFTEEVPYSEGPGYLFCGLPGLVLEAHSTKLDIIVSDIFEVQSTDAPELSSMTEMRDEVPLEDANVWVDKAFTRREAHYFSCDKNIPGKWIEINGFD